MHVEQLWSRLPPLEELSCCRDGSESLRAGAVLMAWGQLETGGEEWMGLDLKAGSARGTAREAGATYDQGSTFPILVLLTLCLFGEDFPDLCPKLCHAGPAPSSSPYTILFLYSWQICFIFPNKGKLLKGILDYSGSAYTIIDV